MTENIRSAAPRILVLEDERIVAMDMEMQLTAFGYEVTGIAASGKEALRLADKTKPDLVVMDINLRGTLDGFRTAAELQKTRKVAIIFVTAFGNEEAQRRADALSPLGYLSKPYRPEDLRAAVSAAFQYHPPST
jgi:CheY-like chemotaxis protein